MPVMVQALTPVFALILLGHLFRRWHFPGDDFWIQAERFTYYVLFPAMLIFKLGQARVPASAYGDILILIVAMLVTMALLLAILQWIWRWPGPVFSSVFQGGIRFNSYVALAAAGMLLGDEGLSLIAIAVAVKVPLLNLLCILMFSMVAGNGAVKLRAVLRAIVSNPLIIGSVVGMVWSYFRIGFHPLMAGILEPLSDLALPLGLMTVGAGLQLKALRGASMPFLVSSAAKLVGFPLLTAGLAMLLGMEGLMVQVAVLLAALPTATSSYILARQLGGDASLMAGIISGQTLLAMVTIPLLLGMLW
ncbi:AEC family transporter [Marinobacter orientalis]|uniref:AEC family transporter n=1 Tax=Marinobacter orientalis TaxID=1928859 RepID=A0A7Y0RE93_9GAMM|nr:AEC family transporter [Marinobacter orientalis]NMT64650.1 AEC family transporter [Marinobacter orientalis]TGX48315.1 AEC family transporter [Marinobacter orientalis]